MYLENTYAVGRLRLVGWLTMGKNTSMEVRNAWRIFELAD